MLFNLSASGLPDGAEQPHFSVRVHPEAPMESLPSKPVLSIQQYLDSIQGTLDTHKTTLYPSFEQILTFPANVFPDPQMQWLGPKMQEDMRILKESCSGIPALPTREPNSKPSSSRCWMLTSSAQATALTVLQSSSPPRRTGASVCVWTSRSSMLRLSRTASLLLWQTPRSSRNRPLHWLLASPH